MKAQALHNLPIQLTSFIGREQELAELGPLLGNTRLMLLPPRRVAEIGTAGQEDAIIDHAIRLLSQMGEVKVNFPHRVYQVYGRQISIAARDGSRETAAVFDLNGRLYQIEAKVLAGGDDTDLIRFQQSLIFSRDVSNRGQDVIRNIREACRGVVNNPAGLDDPRCTRR